MQNNTHIFHKLFILTKVVFLSLLVLSSPYRGVSAAEGDLGPQVDKRVQQEIRALDLGITYADPVGCLIQGAPSTSAVKGLVSFDNLCQEGKDFLEPFANNQWKWEGWKGGRDSGTDNVPNRCNNPGNINENQTYLKLVEEKFGAGSYELGRSECKSGGNTHVWFKTAEAGIYYYQNFIVNRLVNPDGAYAGKNTIGEFLDTYCPPSDGCDAKYKENVLKDAKISGQQATASTTMADIGTALSCAGAAGSTPPPEPTPSPMPGPTTPTTYISVGSIPLEGIEVGVSVYGGSFGKDGWTISNNDQLNRIAAGEFTAESIGAKVGSNASTDDKGMGNRGNLLHNTSSFAELGNGKALGGLPDGAKIEITYGDKTMIIEKGDVGGGGGDVDGKPRAVDLWWQVAKQLEFNDGTGVMKVRAVDPAAAVTAIGGGTEPTGGIDDNSCSGTPGGAAGLVNTDGYAFPLGGVTHENYGNAAMSALPCTNASGCHHKGPAACCDPAFDMGIKTTGKGEAEGNETMGLPVFAIHEAEVVSVKDNYNSTAGCFSIALKQINSKNPADDGWQYWYGHTWKPKVSAGQTIPAGTQVSEVGSRKCAKDTANHLHIDRGVDKSAGGSTGKRDNALIPLINSLYEGIGSTGFEGATPAAPPRGGTTTPTEAPPAGVGQ
jgi:hypothetical protein